MIVRAATLSEELLPDDALVAASLAGERSAFGTLVRRYERSARAVCWSLLRDHHLACDAAQDAFVEAYRGLRGLKDRRAFGGWVMTIARNRALRIAKGRRVEAMLPESLADGSRREEGELLA